MVFKTSLDKLVKGVTVGTTVLFAVLIALQIGNYLSRPSWVPLSVSLLLIVIYSVTYVLRPIKYEIKDNSLIVKRLWKDVTFAIDSIQNVTLIETAMMKHTIRTFGVGGLFGYYGKFYNSKFGKMDWYATRRDKIVLITTLDNRKMVLTPDEPLRLQEALLQLIRK